MASYTTNLNLKKPAGSENVAIGDINNNMDTIDQAYGTMTAQISIKSMTSTDLNAYTGSADYVEHYKASSIASFTNVPPAVSGNAWPFILDVYKIGGIYTKQILHIFLSGTNPPLTYIRQQMYSGGGVVWGDWYYTNITKVTV